MSTNIKASGPALPASVLSLFEKACLQMIAEGRTLSDISTQLALPESEVDGLLKAAEGKLGASNRLHAVSIAMLKGHIEVGESKPDQFGQA